MPSNQSHSDAQRRDAGQPNLDTFLRNAISSGTVDEVQRLIKSHSINIKEYRLANDETPLSSACEEGRLDLVRYFVEEEGVDVTTPDIFGHLPLQDSCRQKYLGLAQYIGSQYSPKDQEYVTSELNKLITPPILAYAEAIEAADAVASGNNSELFD